MDIFLLLGDMLVWISFFIEEVEREIIIGIEFLFVGLLRIKNIVIIINIEWLIVFEDGSN